MTEPKVIVLKAPSDRDIHIEDNFPTEMCEATCSICGAVYYIVPGVWAAHFYHGSMVCGLCALDVWGITDGRKTDKTNS